MQSDVRGMKMFGQKRDGGDLGSARDQTILSRRGSCGFC